MKPHLPECPLVDQPPCQIRESKDKNESGSIFRVYCTNVSDIKTVTDVRQYLMYNKPDVGKATHIIYAYRLVPRGIIQETRTCNPGYSHIGNRRSMHINGGCLYAHYVLYR